MLIMLIEISSIKTFYSALRVLGIYSDTNEHAWKDMKPLDSSDGIFFRGQNRKYRKITTSISRNAMYTRNEYPMYSETVKERTSDLASFQHPIEKLSKMQHYGLPTRLIDFTLNPLTSLFFAVQDANPEESGAVYIFNKSPSDYHELAPQIISLLPTLDDTSFESIISQYTTLYGESISELTIKENINKTVFLEYSTKIENDNPRLINQKGTFAICGNVIDDTGKICSEITDLSVEDADNTILIPGAYKHKILSELKEYFKIDVSFIYPEFLAWADYMKQKYSSPEYSPDELYWIIDTSNTVLPDVSLFRIRAVLNKPIDTEDIKLVGETIFAEHSGTSTAIEIQIYSSFDNYTVRHWTAQGRWISKLLKRKYWPFFYNNDDNGLEWEFSANLTTKEEYFHDEMFKDPKLLMLAHYKNYKILLEIFHQLDTAYDEMEDAFSFSAEAMKRRHTVIKCSEQMFMFGRPKDNNIDSFMCNYKDFASYMEVICLISESYEKFGSRFWYILGNMLSKCHEIIQEIISNKKKWAQALNISFDNLDDELNTNATIIKYAFLQSIPISSNAIEVYFDIDYCLSENDLVITGKTNLFDDANLYISLNLKYGKILFQSYCSVSEHMFELIVPKETLSARHYSIDIALGFPRTQSRKFLDLAGQEYEYLIGSPVRHAGIESSVSFHDYIQIENGRIIKTDFVSC